MDIKTISATLAILGGGLSLNACKSGQTEATEVPAATPSNAVEAGDVESSAPEVSPPTASEVEATPEAAPEPTPSAEENTVSEAVAPSPEQSEPEVIAEPTDKASTPKKSAPASKAKKKAKAEAKCGEGTCG